MTLIELGPRYEVLRELGSGASGRVFLVRDTHLGLELALKQLHEASPEEIELFQREFALLSEIEHPGIARAFDFGWAGGLPYFTSEYIAGRSLGLVDRLEPGEDLLRLSIDLAAALAFLHGNGVLHLDVKPGNLIAPDPDHGSSVVLVDFGIYRRAGHRPPGVALRGSLGYMAPEHLKGEAPGPWTDVYALGATLYRLAAGVLPRPVPGQDPSGDPEGWAPTPPDIAALEPSIREGLGGVLMRCLALDPRARFASAGETLAALERLARKPRSAAPRPTVYSRTLGRSEELALLRSFVDAAAEGRPGPIAMLVTGPPGMGQTQILRELKVMAQTRRLDCYLETGYRGRPGHPGALLSSIAAQIPPSRGDARARWLGFLGRLRAPRKPARGEAGDSERRLRRAQEVALAADALEAPLLLGVDGLQHFDEISIGLVVDLARHLAQSSDDKGPSLRLALGYREEGTSAPALRELTQHLLGSGRAEVITLRPLSVVDALALREERSGASPTPRTLQVFQDTGGVPARIVAPGGVAPEVLPPTRPRDGRDALPVEAERTLAVLVALERPAPPEELRLLASLSRKGQEAALRELQSRDLATVVESSTGATEWIALPEASTLTASSKDRERKAIHAAIAKRLSRGEPARALEALRHWVRAGRTREVIASGLVAARHLKSTLQHGAALEALRAVLDAIPRHRARARIEPALEAAELHARVGNLDDGVRLLRDLLPGAAKAGKGARIRLLLRLAVLHGRRGDYRRAESLFREGLGAPGAARLLSRRERLLFLNEHAAMLAVMGEHARALALCDEGLRAAGKATAAGLREVILDLHATRASVALRSYDFERAEEESEAALGIAESLGSPANRAAILNNLGIIHAQCDRYEAAVRAYREAERTCLQLDEGPSLVSILGNRAILHAKMGDFEAMEEAQGEAERLARAAGGRRQTFFAAYAAGLSSLHRGRPDEARLRLDEAIALGESMGDRHLTTFGRLYRAEALTFLGAYSAALSETELLIDPRAPAQTRRSALARRAYLLALLGSKEGAVRCVDEHEAAGIERPILFLDAWDRLYTGWALSVCGELESGLSRVLRAEEFFSGRGLAPAASLARWIRVEATLLSNAAVEDPADPGPPPRWQGDLAGAIGPLLEARLLLARSPSREESARAADLLAVAASSLAVNPLPEWSLRADVIRAALGGDLAEARARAGERRAELARDLPRDLRQSYLESPHWKAWTSVQPVERGKGAPLEAPPSGKDSRTEEIGPRPRPGSARAQLVSKSPSMRRLLAVLDKLRGSEVPVLIQGETGSGKELVARALHEESPRAGGPFRVIDAVTIPGGLLETELFGAREGAFTDLAADRQGIFAAAAGGTVLIDGIAGMPLDLQAKLLRVLAEGRVRPVGSDEEVELDLRFIFSSPRGVDLELREGKLRADMYHRIRGVVIDVPPLRQRPEDLPDLVQAILAEGPTPAPRLGEGLIERLRELPWPGNVRELRNLLLRLRLESTGVITVDALERATGGGGTRTIFATNLLAGEDLEALKGRLERDYIVYHLRRLGGSTDALCRFLGIRKRQLYRRCARLGIPLRRGPGNPGTG